MRDQASQLSRKKLSIILVFSGLAGSFLMGLGAFLLLRSPGSKVIADFLPKNSRLSGAAIPLKVKLESLAQGNVDRLVETLDGPLPNEEKMRALEHLGAAGVCDHLLRANKFIDHEMKEVAVAALFSLRYCPDPQVALILRQVFLSRLRLQATVLDVLELRTQAGIAESSSFRFLSHWVHLPQKKKDDLIVRKSLMTLKHLAEALPAELGPDFAEIRARCRLWDACEYL